MNHKKLLEGKGVLIEVKTKAQSNYFCNCMSSRRCVSEWLKEWWLWGLVMIS